MKKITLLFILFTGFVFGQAPVGMYEIILNGWIRGANNHHCGEAFINVGFTNSPMERVLTKNYSEDSPYDPFNVVYPFSANKIPNQFYFSTSRRTRSSCNGPRPNNHGSIWSGDRFRCLNFNFVFEQFQESGSDGSGLWNSFGNLKVEPKLVILDNFILMNGAAITGNYIPINEDSINIKSHTGFLPSEYNWEYSMNGIYWSSLPSNFNGISEININLLQAFDGSLPFDYHGATFYLRQKSCNRLSEVISYKVEKSAPHIVSFETEKTSCFDSSDGKVKLIFDRFIGSSLRTSTNNTIVIPEETLNYSLARVNNGIATPLSNGAINMSADLAFTINNLDEGDYILKLNGYLSPESTYNLGARHSISFSISKPAPVDFSTSKVDVWCNGGSDGEILITASGGTNLTANDKYKFEINGNGIWIPFINSTTHTITGLLPGNYTIRVKDSKNCISKEQSIVGGAISLGNIKFQTQIISQPTAPVSITYSYSLQPSFFGATNGQIVAAVIGGTRFSNNSYSFEWKNSTGIVQTNCTTSFNNGIFTITLPNIPSDTYTLTVKDKNYDDATNKTGCTIANSTFFLNQPAKIVITLNVQNPISCNATNLFGNETNFDPQDNQRDESQNGIIIATVTGGVPLAVNQNGGLPYFFKWKKFVNGAWVDWNDGLNDNTAKYISDGNYSLNIEDKNGIVLGNYVNNVLATETPVTLYVQQPDKLELNFSKVDVTCSSSPSGQATANATGGVPPFTYTWSTGETTQTITGLQANNYFVNITDAKGCKVQGSILLQQPNGIAINQTLTNPTCFGGNDGKIITALTGGTLPYLYKWSTATNPNLATTPNLLNQPQGAYNLLVKDGNNCIYTATFNLADPAKLTIDLGLDRTLCNNQNLILNPIITDPNATYQWTSSNGFTSSNSQVSLTQAGSYHVKVTSSLGCIAEDDITITTSQVNIASEFLLTSQAYIDEEIILINTSNPLGQNTIWQIPSTITIINQNDNYIVLKFNSIGSHTISLKQTQGDCYALFSKVINVEQRSTLPNSNTASNPFITTFIVSPNPNNGIFNVVIGLEQISPVNVRLFAYNGQNVLDQQNANGQKSYVINFNNTTLAAGTYFLVVETSNQTMVKKIIIL